MKKKGFTLIELLAVVIILAIIALIATPIILDVVDSVRSKANKESVNGIINAGRNYYAESMLDDNKKLQMDGKTNIYNDIVLSGEKPKDGNLFVNEEGQVAVLVVIGNKCYKKSFYGQLEELTNEDENCDIGKVINDENPPTITFKVEGIEGNNGWYKSNVYVEIKVEDKESGVNNYSWCSTPNEECSLTNIETTNKKIEILNGYKLCAQANDKSGNSSELKCTEVFKIDNIEPEITGIGDITVSKDEIVDLTKDVEVNDLLSGIDTFTYTPTSVDTTKAGTIEVKYTVYDKAGNKREVTRKVFVETNVPTVEFKVADGIINSNGWANEDFYVTINAIDNSGHGIKEFKVCTATTDTCDPSSGSIITGSTATRLISTESNNNRICVQTTDNYNQTSEIICSNAYKLDKTSASLELNKYTYIEGFKGWTYKNGAYEQDGIVYLPEATGSQVVLPYIAVNETNWNLSFEGYVTQITPRYQPNGAIYGHADYYDEEFKSFMSNNGFSGNGFASVVSPEEQWKKITDFGYWFANDTKYLKWIFLTDGDISTGPVQIKNFKIKGQLYQDFYNITLSTNDLNGVEVIKYALGTKDKVYFENNGITITTNEITVTENGTYTFYAKDKAGNVTIETIIIDKIDKEAPIITAKSTSNEVIYKTNNEIKSYFDINQNGIAAITQTTCINKSDNSVITNTNSLEVGSHTIECTALKANNKETKALTTINVVDPNITLTKELDTNNQNLVLKSSEDIINATYTWYKDNIAVSTDKEYTISSTGIYKLNVTKDGFSKTTSEFIVNGYQVKNDKTLFSAKEDNNCVLRRNGSDEIETFNYNEKCTITTALNMVKNGYLEYKDNTNFPEFTYDENDDALYSLYNAHNVYSGALIPIDYNKTYKQSIEIKSENSLNFRHYLGILEYDIDKYLIESRELMYMPNTLTYLTKDLNDGDTVVYLNDVSNFVVSSSSPYYQLGLKFWNYKDSTGFTYPELTYSRYYYNSLYTYNSVDKENNTITLKEPWKYGTYKSGTKLSQPNAGLGSNHGLRNGDTIPNTYTKYENTLHDVLMDANGYVDRLNYFRYPSKYMKFYIHANYHDYSNSNKVTFKNIVITEE